MNEPLHAREVFHRSAHDTRRVPWKNGRGVTEELAIWPTRATFERGDFDWRVSKTRVEEAGPFSRFPNFERILVVTSGAGLVLSHAEHAPRARLRALEPYRFAGDWPTRCELVRGPVADFTVLFRPDKSSASIDVSRLGRRRARDAIAAEHAFVHVLAGGIVARVTGEDEAFDLATGESLWITHARESDEVELAGTVDDTLAVVVRIQRSTQLG